MVLDVDKAVACPSWTRTAAIAVLALPGAIVVRAVRGATDARTIALMMGGAVFSVAGMWLNVT